MVSLASSLTMLVMLSGLQPLPLYWTSEHFQLPTSGWKKLPELIIKSRLSKIFKVPILQVVGHFTGLPTPQRHTYPLNFR